VSGRRELTTVVLAAVAAGGLALSAGGQSWAAVSVQRAAPLPPIHGVLTGSDAAPLVSAAGLVLLAAGVALLAMHGAARTIVGLLMAVAGGVLGWSGVRALTGGLVAESTRLPFVGRGPGPVTVEVSAAGPSLVIVAGVLSVAAGLLVVLRSRAWPAMGRRYERTPAVDGGPDGRPPARPETDEDRAQAAWRALDRGEDPTDLAPGHGRF
jgi:uncharacterized membrane protein (TIGR02234 family)